MMRTRLRYPSPNDENENKTVNVWVSMTRPRPRLQMCESQWRDRDWKIWVSMTRLRPRLKKSESKKRDWAKDVETEAPLRLLLISDSPYVEKGMLFALFDAVKSKLSLIETEKFLGCRDRDWRIWVSITIPRLADIWLPIRGEENDLCTLKWILYDAGLLVGWVGYLML